MTPRSKDDCTKLILHSLLLWPIRIAVLRGCERSLTGSIGYGDLVHHVLYSRRLTGICFRRWYDTARTCGPLLIRSAVLDDGSLADRPEAAKEYIDSFLAVLRHPESLNLDASKEPSRYILKSIYDRLCQDRECSPGTIAFKHCIPSNIVQV